MMIEAIKIRKIYGERAIKLLEKLNLIHRGKRIKRVNDFILIPFARRPSKRELDIIKENFGVVQFCVNFFEDKVLRPHSLAEALRGLIPESKLKFLPRSFDIIGDIAIIEIPSELMPFKSLIGEALMRIHPHVKTVFAKKSGVNGVFRVRKLEHIAGLFSSITFHREYGCTFKVDVLNVYFSPRLSFERFRISRLVRDGEVIIDMFSGVGPFSILMAKFSRVIIYSIDINPHAIFLLNENLKLNKLRGLVHPILADANYSSSFFKGKSFADRIIMNLPESSHKFLNMAVRLIKSGGIIHYYCFSDGDPIENARLKLLNKLREIGVNDFSIISMRKVKPVAPHKWQVAIDFKIFK